MCRPSNSALAVMVEMCEERYSYLVASGVDEDVAADRTMDALEAACGEHDAPFDKHDILFFNQLQTAAGRS